MDYSELTFTNNFVFCKVLENNLELCRQLLELILGIQIKKVELADKEKVLDITPDGKSVRLDIYVEDDIGTVYNIEMQVATKRNLPRRSRYYQGMIDLNSIEKGAKYNALKKSYVIFICMFDPFNKNLPVYTFTNRCKEMPKLELGDETAKVFINPYGDTEGLSADLKSFFEYLKEELTQSEFTKKLDVEVERVRANKEWRREYMTWLSELEESKEEAREEGREQGREEGRAQGQILYLIKTVYKKMLKSKTNEEIANEIEEDINLIERIKKAIIEYKKDCSNEEFNANRVLEYYR